MPTKLGNLVLYPWVEGYAEGSLLTSAVAGAPFVDRVAVAQKRPEGRA